MGKVTRLPSERKFKNKNRTPSKVSGSDGLGVAGAGGTDAWAGEKKAKIQSTPTSENLGKNVRADIVSRDDDDSSDNTARAIDDVNEQWLKQIEGFDWSSDYLRMATELCAKQLNNRLPDYDDEDFWAYLDEDQLAALNVRLAVHRIRAYELLDLDKEEDSAIYSSSTLEDQGFYEWCEREFEWYFDPEFCQHAGFEDYQRLVLRNNGEYGQWEYYRKTCNTLQGDQEYVQFWEKLSNETKWIENARSASSHAWDKLELLAFYQAMKIATEFKNIFTPLIYSSFTEFMWTIEFVNVRYKDLTFLYFEIWKRVAKQKMTFKEALKQVYDNGVPSSCIEMELELRKQDLGKSGPVTHKYETYFAGIDEDVSEDRAHILIREAVEMFVSRHQTYYDYAKKKLGIAEKIGLIVPSSPACTKAVCDS